MSSEKLDIELLVKSFKVTNIEAFNSYLKEVWIDLTQRTESKKGIDRITFSAYYQVPGILSVRLFSVFNKGHTDYIDKDEFLNGMNNLFCESYDITSKFIFDFYDFDKDGLIDKEDIRTVLSYIALNNNNNSSEYQGYLNRVNSQKELYNLLENSFKNVNKEKIDYKEFLDIIENTASDIYISILLFLLDKKPFNKSAINEYGKNNPSLSPKKIHKVNSIPKLIASPLVHESSFTSSSIFQRESKKRKTLSLVMNQAQKDRLFGKIKAEENNEINRKKARAGTFHHTRNSLSNINKKTESKFNNNNTSIINNNEIDNHTILYDEQNENEYNENDNIIHFVDDDDEELNNEKENFVPVIRKTKTNLKNIKEDNFSSAKNKNYNYNDIELMPAYKQNETNITEGKDLSETGSQFSGEEIKKDETINEEKDKENESEKVFEKNDEEEEDEEMVKYEGYLYKMINNSKLKRLYFKLLHKDLYFYKNDKETVHKGMHNLSGVFLKEEKPHNFNGTTFYSFAVIYPKKTRVYYTDNLSQYKIWVAKLKLATGYTNLTDLYEVSSKLGNGKFGLVKLGINKQTKKKVAIKIMSKKDMNTEDLELVRTEIEILKICQHPNIIHLYEVFENEEYFYIIMEYCAGGDLFSYLEKRHFHLKEIQACRIIHKMLTALYYIHSYGIIHRDIKPENVLMTSNEDNADIKILDFGLGKILGPGEVCTEPYGTLSYVAPEVLLEKSYNKQVDCWSLGITAYLLIGGRLPFDHPKNDREIARQTIHDPPPFKGNIWKKVSKEAIDFVNKLLVKEPEKRMSIKEALEHDWIKKYHKSAERRNSTHSATSFEEYTFTGEI